MKIMLNDSANKHHANQTTRTATIIDALKQRAQAVVDDRSIAPEARAIVRYALETSGNPMIR